MKVLIIRDKTLSFNGGIKRHCDDLYALMSACDVDVMPVEDLPATYVKWIRKYKYDTKALRKSYIVLIFILSGISGIP